MRKKSVRAGHKGHLKKLWRTVNDILVTSETYLESELLYIKDYFERKALVKSRLHKDILVNIEDIGWRKG